jgi:hypothetical protein
VSSKQHIVDKVEFWSYKSPLIAQQAAKSLVGEVHAPYRLPIVKSIYCNIAQGPPIDEKENKALELWDVGHAPRHFP